MRTTKNRSFELLVIYAAVPRIACKGLCSASCGPIFAGEFERRRFEELSGNPFPVLQDVAASSDLTCPRLNAVGQCDSYYHRPLICRLWGVADGMPCPHGCVPERQLTDRAASALLKHAESLEVDGGR